eukprot:2846979-Pyramimonas_sp.AAC.1
MSPDLRTVIHLAKGPPAQVPTVDMRFFQSAFTLGRIKAGGTKPTGGRAQNGVGKDSGAPAEEFPESVMQHAHALARDPRKLANLYKMRDNG